MSQSIFDLFKTVIEGIQKEPAKNPATTTPDPSRRTRTATRPADERWRSRRDQQAERARQQRDREFGRHMRTGREPTQAQRDAHNQEMLERAVAKFEAQRDELEKAFVKQRDQLMQRFTTQMEKLSAQHSARIEKLVEQARSGRKIRASTDGTQRYDQWRRKQGKPSWAQ